ncbi:MAG: hypothetical protein SFU98_05595 [Leptospiraceae bacterium]|nr:hypothetical protein [Leptospiraceae bacterium]
MNGNDLLSSYDSIGEIIPFSGTTEKTEFLEKTKILMSKIQFLNLEIQKFNTQDRPSYQTWMKQNFHDNYQLIQEKTEKLVKYKKILETVQEEIFYFRLTPSQAYKKVMDRFSRTGKIGMEKPFNDDWNGFYEETDFFEEDDVLGKEINQFYRKLNEEKQKDFEVRDSQKNIPNGKSFTEDSFKEKYHYLVMRLHPDKILNPTEDDRRIWQMVQDAYHTNNLEALDAIYASYKIGSSGNEEYSNLLDIKFNYKKIYKQFKKLNKEYQSLKKSPAWGFRSWKKTKLTRKMNDARMELDKYCDSLTKDLGKIERTIEFLSGKLKTTQTKSNHSDDDFIELHFNF